MAVLYNLQEVTKPCVYKFLAEDKTPLYVGYSDRGYGRVFGHAGDGDRYKRNRIAALKETVFVEVEFFEDTQEARDLEKKLIHALHPKFNRCVTCWITTGEKQADENRDLIKANVKAFLNKNN